MQAGDILAWKVNPEAPLKDRLIGWGESVLKQCTPQNRQYYHVAFVSYNTTQMFSSQPPKIELYPIPSPLPSYVEIYRLKQNPVPAQWNAIFKYAESRRGRWYPYLGVLTAGWLSGNLEFCSQYIEDSFADGQIVLAPDIRFSSPDDIVSSPLLAQIA